MSTDDKITRAHSAREPNALETASNYTQVDHDVHPEKVSATGTPVSGGDIGATWLAQYSGNKPDLDELNNKQVGRKIDSCLLPIIFAIYFCQQLDKSSISFASVFGFQTDANLQGVQYAWLGSVIYVAQLIFQPLSVYALIKFPVNYWICFCFFGWGISCMILAAFNSFPGLLVFRFILGAFEASISPSMLIIVSMWWTRREQPMRNNIWYSANGFALILGSLLAYGLASWRTSLYTHQLIFLFSGAIAVIIAIPTVFLLPGHPTRTRWLTEEQKYLALERVRLNNTGTQNTDFKWSQIRECFSDPKIWGFVIMIFCVSFVSGGISAFGPLIIQGFVSSPFETILYNMIPGAISIVTNILAAYAVQHTKRKAPILLGILIFPIAGAAALYALPRGDQYRSQLLAVYFIFQIFQPVTPVIFSWTFANVAGHTKKSATTGALYIGLCVGNIVGPQLYLQSERPYYKTGLTANLVVLAILFGLVILQTLYLMFLNKRNNKRRLASGRTGKNVDYSLEASKDWAKIKAAQVERTDGGSTGEVYNSKAFDDMTDLQNEDFVYSL